MKCKLLSLCSGAHNVINLDKFFRFFLVAKSIENIITENHEKLDKSQELAVNIPIDENWFVKEVCKMFIQSNLEVEKIHYCLFPNRPLK